jgi:hypothetical protein
VSHLDAARSAYLVAAATHLGFQATVTVVVYPALARVRPAHWREQHDRHTRTITPLVAGVYALLLGTAVWLLVVRHGSWEVAAVAPGALAVLLTAVLAGPMHGRLSRRDDAVLARLLAVDRVRLALAVLAVVAAYVDVVH